MTAPPSEDPFATVLVALHRAIYGYGVLGAHLDRDGKAAARQAEADHRDRRDAIIERIAAAGGSAPPAAAAYTPQSPVTDEASALRLAITIEEATALAWRHALAYTAGADRQLALDGLIACAVRATQWREAAGVSPVTVAFPGTPG